MKGRAFRHKHFAESILLNKGEGLCNNNSCVSSAVVICSSAHSARLGRAGALVLSTQRYLDIRSRAPSVTALMHCTTTSSSLTYHLDPAVGDTTSYSQCLQIGTSSNVDARSAVAIWRSICEDAIMNRISGFPRRHRFVRCFV